MKLRIDRPSWTLNVCCHREGTKTEQKYSITAKISRDAHGEMANYRDPYQHVEGGLTSALACNSWLIFSCRSWGFRSDNLSNLVRDPQDARKVWNRELQNWHHEIMMWISWMRNWHDCFGSIPLQCSFMYGYVWYSDRCDNAANDIAA